MVFMKHIQPHTHAHKTTSKQYVLFLVWRKSDVFWVSSDVEMHFSVTLQKQVSHPHPKRVPTPSKLGMGKLQLIQSGPWEVSVKTTNKMGAKLLFGV